MNIAITGSSGFLGGHLLRKLDNKFKINVFDRTKHDFFKEESLRQFLGKADVVVHLAGVNKDGLLKDIIRINVLGTKKLLDAIGKVCPDAKFIFASSFQVYDKEDIFGISKWAAEQLIADYVENKLLKKAIILRFSNIYGPEMKPFKNSVLATFTYLIKNGKEVVINGTGKQTRDFLFVDDAVDAIIKAIERNPRGLETFDICTGNLTSINQLVQTITGILDVKVSIRYNRISQSVKKIKKDYKKAGRMLDWRPRLLLDEGLGKILKK